MMMRLRRYAFLPLLLVVAMAGCKRTGADYALKHEDKEAKQMLQGVWVNDEEGNPAILATGDSILYPDTSSLPVRFWIYQDSLYLQGHAVNRYKITKQAEHVFRFVNHAGDEIKLVKSTDRVMAEAFYQYRPYALNIFRTIDCDTTGGGGGLSYRCKIHIEPTSDRIVSPSYNDEGLEVENLYLDNNARLSVAVGNATIYSHDFRKQEFSSFVPAEFMAQSILRNIQYNHADTSAVYLDAIIGIPDAATSYVVELKVSKTGKLTKRLK